MRDCPACGRSYAEVKGAPEQVCPACGFAVAANAPATAVGAAVRADPAGAAGASFRLWASAFVPLVVAWTPAALVAVAAAVALHVYVDAAGVPVDQIPLLATQDDLAALGLDAQSMLAFLGVALPLALARVVAGLVGWTLVARVVLARLGEEAPPIKWGATLGLALALTLLYVAGFTLFIIPFLVLFHWYLYAPAALAGGARGVGDALETSRRFAKERRTYGFTALALLVGFGTLLAGGVVGALLASLLEAFGVPSTLALEIAGPLGLWPFAPLVPVMAAAFPALARKASAPAPVRPDARPAERFRTTKCPKCATLVPYTATGQAMDVTCPVCGTTGRVL